MILDTTVLVDLLRGDERTRARVEALEARGEILWIPTPAVFEVWEGTERAERSAEARRRVSEFLEGYTVLPFESNHAARAGVMSGILARRGEMVDPVDAQIAGMALVEGRPVLTRNVKHFRRVEGLRVETY